MTYLQGMTLVLNVAALNLAVWLIYFEYVRRGK